MPRIRPQRDAIQGYLDGYRVKVDQLQAETAAEFGWRSVPPETLSMIAVLATSIPLLALFLPVAPLPPAVWQVVVADLVVWIAAFRVQRPRYEAY